MKKQKPQSLAPTSTGSDNDLAFPNKKNVAGTPNGGGELRRHEKHRNVKRTGSTNLDYRSRMTAPNYHRVEIREHNVWEHFRHTSSVPRTEAAEGSLLEEFRKTRARKGRDRSRIPRGGRVV